MQYQYQTFADLSTIQDKMTVVTVYAGGNTALKRAMPFFAAYKYYKLGPVTVRLVPASTMPVDPTGLSYEAGKTTVDPRDQLSPGLVRITNGEDFYNNQNTGSDPEKLAIRGMYAAMMMDDRWFKWSLQQGITKTAEPRYWMIGQIRQDYYPGSRLNIPQISADGKGLGDTGIMSTVLDNDIITDYPVKSKSSGHSLFQTGDHGVLGWLPTDALITVQTSAGATYTPSMNAIPQVELFRIILPPAYKTVFYYRMFVNETVYFKEPVVQNPEFYSTTASDAASYAPMDRMIRIEGIKATEPKTDYKANQPSKPATPNDGGNAKGNIEVS